MGKEGIFGGKVLENSMRKTVLSRIRQNFFVVRPGRNQSIRKCSERYLNESEGF